MKRWTKRLCALALAFMLLTGAACAEDFLEWISGEETPYLPPEATPAPAYDFSDCAIEDDGRLRVYLRSLDAPAALHLTLAGEYAVEGDRGFRFDDGTVLTLYNEGGEVWLQSGGVTIDLGLAVTLTRRGDGGLYIEESEFPNLYCGDLSVSAMSAGLRPVLNIGIEDYLRGVVAYEMSDSFPLEALKAQAVAARTYALKRKRSAGRRDYDVVDTTADQVYKGCDPEYANVDLAVRDTDGLACVFGDAFATCYYTASNGGQTALPSQIWGSGDEADAYLAMADDPWDLENPRSLQNALTFDADCNGSDALRALLTSALHDVMADEGFSDDEWALDSIAAIEPVDPMFEGSRMYESLAFDLRVRVAENSLATPAPTPAASSETSPEASPAPAPGAMSIAPEAERWVLLDDPRRVTLDVYADIKDGLSLGLNGADCELLSVETEAAPDGRATAFTLVMRRYGHGVGMSQRGAQWMAGEYGKSFMDILGFYYPGAQVQRVKWPEPAPEAEAEPVGASRPKPTPLPTPAPLPALRAGEHYARVNATLLNVRERPTTSARILDMLDQNVRVIVAGPADADGWVPVKTGDVEGYVKEEYLTGEQ